MDFSLTLEDTGVTVWAEDNVNAECTRAPRQITHLNTDGSECEYASGYNVVDYIVAAHEKIKIDVTNAGAGSRLGIFDIWVGT